MRNNYDLELNELSRQIIAMGDLASKAIYNVAAALKRDDKALAKEVIDNDKNINEQEKNIQNHCLKLLLLQQPVAKDLRNISSVLKMITDIERIGDYAVDIADIILYLDKAKVNLDYAYITEMVKTCIEMVDDSIKAYVTQDETLARKVFATDDIVDGCFYAMKSSLISLIREDVDSGEVALDLMMIAKYLERIGDHSTNIAEWVVYAITGETIKGN